MSGTVRVLREADVRAALPMDVCIDAVERALVAYTRGDAEMPGVIHLDVPEAGGEIHIKAGHLHGAPAYALKASSGFAGDPPALDGLVVVFDAATGAPVAFLLDHGFVTDQRTGAAGGVAAKVLAPERVDAVAVIGTGIQARKQVEALRVVRPDLAEIRVWGRDPKHAAVAAADVGGERPRPSRRPSSAPTSSSRARPRVSRSSVPTGSHRVSTSRPRDPTAPANRSWIRSSCGAPISSSSTRASRPCASASSSTPRPARAGRRAWRDLRRDLAGPNVDGAAHCLRSDRGRRPGRRRRERGPRERRRGGELLDL